MPHAIILGVTAIGQLEVLPPERPLNQHTGGATTLNSTDPIMGVAFLRTLWADTAPVSGNTTTRGNKSATATATATTFAYGAATQLTQAIRHLMYTLLRAAEPDAGHLGTASQPGPGGGIPISDI
ncbi:hypothetical protein MMC24_001044 [Lignoscripta atroalba]|nr:hypothetical protein [Lignoscripta atroalba]